MKIQIGKIVNGVKQFSTQTTAIHIPGLGIILAESEPDSVSEFINLSKDQLKKLQIEIMKELHDEHEATNVYRHTRRAP